MASVPTQTSPQQSGRAYRPPNRIPDTERRAAVRESAAWRAAWVEAHGFYKTTPMPGSVTLVNINWQHVEPALHASEKGAMGVSYVAHGGVDYVVKSSALALREWMNAQLADAIGLPTPERAHVVLQAPNALTALCIGTADQEREKLRARSKAEGDGLPADTVLVMSRVKGYTFAEWTDRDRSDFQRGTPRALGMLRKIGQFVAFDYLIANYDRFPLPQLRGRNPGNLMIVGDTLCGIDNTICKASWAANRLHAVKPYQEHLKAIFQAMPVDNSSLPPAFMRHFAALPSFFPQKGGNPIPWETHVGMQHAFVQGFCKSVRAIAEITPEHLRAIVNACGGANCIEPEIAHVLFTNHALFREAAARCAWILS